MDVHGTKLAPHAIHNRNGSGTRRRLAIQLLSYAQPV